MRLSESEKEVVEYFTSSIGIGAQRYMPSPGGVSDPEAKLVTEGHRKALVRYGRIEATLRRCTEWECEVLRLAYEPRPWRSSAVEYRFERVRRCPKCFWRGELDEGHECSNGGRARRGEEERISRDPGARLRVALKHGPEGNDESSKGAPMFTLIGVALVFSDSLLRAWRHEQRLRHRAWEVAVDRWREQRERVGYAKGGPMPVFDPKGEYTDTRENVLRWLERVAGDADRTKRVIMPAKREAFAWVHAALAAYEKERLSRADVVEELEERNRARQVRLERRMRGEMTGEAA